MGKLRHKDLRPVLQSLPKPPARLYDKGQTEGAFQDLYFQVKQNSLQTAEPVNHWLLPAGLMSVLPFEHPPAAVEPFSSPAVRIPDVTDTLCLSLLFTCYFSV